MTEILERHGSQAEDGHRLLRVGIVLFLFALLVGLAVPRFAVPRLGLSTHLLGLMHDIARVHKCLHFIHL